MRITHAPSKLDVNLSDPKVWARPYDLYARLHGLDGLAHAAQPMMPAGTWLAARHADVNQVLKDAKVFKSDARSIGTKNPLDAFWVPGVMKAFSRSMVMADGGDHRRLRRLANKAFTPTRVAELGPHIEQIVRGLLDEAGKAPRFDLMSALALPLPLRLIAELMGVEADERADFHVMLEQALDMSQPWRMLLRTPTYIRLYRFFDRLLARKRADPRDDLISALVTAEEEGDRLSPQELMGTVFLLLLAGHETTVNLIGNGALALLEHPDQLARLRANPDLIPNAIEEMLRFYSPANTTSTRYVAEPVTLGGVQLKPGDVVMPMVGAANRDPEAFAEPGRFDVGRDPNPHLAFGAGVHFCIGASLSRLEAKIAFELLLERFPDLRLGVDRDQLTWRGANTGLRGLETLPVVVG